MWWRCLRGLWNSINNAIDHDGIEHAGYLAYLIMLTVFPFLVFFVALVGFFGKSDLGAMLVNLILNSPWASFIDALKPRILEITSGPPQGLLTLAIISAIWTASSIFEALRTILNKVHRVTNAPPYLWRRLFSMLEFAVMIAFTMVMMFALVILPNVWSYLYNFLQHLPIALAFLGPEGMWLRYIILTAFGFLAISSLYYFLPNCKQRFADTLAGTIFVMVGWGIFTSLFRYYIQSVPSINIIYGSIAGIIIALFYFYICSFIFILGAEINCQVHHCGKKSH